MSQTTKIQLNEDQVTIPQLYSIEHISELESIIQHFTYYNRLEKKLH
jgi:hypothetical protein